MADAALRVAQIWRYPVKSMAGERMQQAEVGPKGIPFDRGWAVRDEKAGVIRSARYIPKLLMCSARYLPDTDAGLVPHVEITLPDGSTVRSDDPDVHRRLSEAIGRPLSLWSLKPESEVEHLRTGPQAFKTGNFKSEMRLIFGLKDDEPLPDFSAMPRPLMRELAELVAPRGTYVDAFPFDILTTSSIRHLQRHVPDAELDVRRFRPNVLVDDGGASDEPREHAWLGRSVRVDQAEFDVVMECPRCTIIAAEQAGGITRNSAITRAIVREMRQVMSVYCNVRRPGLIRLGSELEVLESETPVPA